MRIRDMCYQDEVGMSVGWVTEHSPTAFFAEFHTSMPDEWLGRVGYMQSIEGLFPTLEDAVASIEANYDETKDNIIASSRP